MNALLERNPHAPRLLALGIVIALASLSGCNKPAADSAAPPVASGDSSSAVTPNEQPATPAPAPAPEQQTSGDASTSPTAGDAAGTSNEAPPSDESSTAPENMQPRSDQKSKQDANAPSPPPYDDNQGG
mgnify:CR=1 FL=1